MALSWGNGRTRTRGDPPRSLQPSHSARSPRVGLWDDDDPIADAYATTLGGQRHLLTADPTVTESFFNDPEGLEGDDLIEYGVAR